MDIHASFDDGIVGEVRRPVPIRPSVAKLAQDDGDIDVAIRLGLAPGAAAEQYEVHERVAVGGTGRVSKQVERAPSQGCQPFGRIG